MKRRYVHKASPITEAEPVSSATIHIEQDFPENEGMTSLGLEQLFQDDATKIMEALMQLPQGTRDRLLIKMLEQKKTLLIV